METFKRKVLWRLITILLVALFLAVILFNVYTHYFKDYEGKPQRLHTIPSEHVTMQMDLNITAIGDSLTQGVGDPEEQGYAGITAKGLQASSAVAQVNFEDYGVRGDTTSDLLDVLNKSKVEDALAHSDYIFLTIGGNDLVGVLKKHFLQLDLDDFEAQRVTYTKNLYAILTKIRQLNSQATIYYLGLYNPFEDYFGELNSQFVTILDEWNNATQTILNLYPNTTFVPTYDLFHGKTDQLLYTDHFHPNKEGYHLMAKRLLNTIEK
ncbi:SGNH/GDSL hydrolase family protein [Pullulanibacillus camelliae]|uniref:SGNH/GDSL hydrolase family protein n=1 Tax=Pullulanibacillus camelliae TaxID=1707096 RepID=UPI00166DA555|nr:SGNH/GDSL hydrolase family protein [Pullulanibacillus camelliae]